jgi:hypothetical protein
MKFIIQGDSIQTFTGKKGEQSARRLLLLGAEADLSEQLVELNLPADHPEIGKGKAIEVHVSEISSIFAGKPRIRGTIVKGAKA